MWVSSLLAGEGGFVSRRIRSTLWASGRSQTLQEDLPEYCRNYTGLASWHVASVSAVSYPSGCCYLLHLSHPGPNVIRNRADHILSDILRRLSALYSDMPCPSRRSGPSLLDKPEFSLRPDRQVRGSTLSRPSPPCLVVGVLWPRQPVRDSGAG